MSPKISVIMSVYNTAPYLRRALDSVCNQTFRDLEILCINDGSTDGSATILEEYAAGDTRIRLIDHGENRGVAAARNSGLDAAEGETIAVLDSDDALSKNFFAALWSVYEGGDCDIAKGRYVECELDGRWHEKDKNASIQKDVLQFTYQWTTALYSTSFLRRHGLRLSTEVAFGEDSLFLYQLMGHQPRIAFTDQAIYYYLRNGVSTTHAYPEEYYLACIIKVAELLKKYLPAYPRESQRRKVFERILHLLMYNLGERFAACDATPHLAEIQAILADDEFYAPTKTFPFVRQALQAKNIQELKATLKGFRGHLIALSLRGNLRGTRS